MVTLPSIVFSFHRRNDVPSIDCPLSLLLRTAIMITTIAELITAATLRLWRLRSDEVLAIDLPVIKITQTGSCGRVIHIIAPAAWLLLQDVQSLLVGEGPQ